MNRGNVLMVVVVVVGCVWRGLWLSAGVTNSTSVADVTRTELLRQITDELKTRGHVAGPQNLQSVQVLAYFGDASSAEPSVAASRSWKLDSVQRFDPNAEVWIVSGADGKPGWDGWDDNQNGTVDDLSELGAAWSDDHCLTPLDSGYERVDPVYSRIINRGTFVPSDFESFAADHSFNPDESDHQPHSWRVTFVDQAAAELR
ncbi:hypothetical protein [Rhodopirellula baltica]